MARSGRKSPSGYAATTPSHKYLSATTILDISTPTAEVSFSFASKVIVPDDRDATPMVHLDKDDIRTYLGQYGARDEFIDRVGRREARLLAEPLPYDEKDFADEVERLRLAAQSN